MKFVIYCFILFLYIPKNSFSQNDSIKDVSTGVEIIFVASGNIFPASWYGEKIQCKTESLDTSEVKRSVRIVKKALAKYPAGIIKKNLKKVYMLKSLSFYGVVYGGTNSKDIVYMANSGIANNYTDDFIERVFHEEFSSILLNNYPTAFDKKKWADINGQEFRYGAVNGYEAIKAGKDSEDLDKKYNEIGFLDEYAMSTLENDFNSFAKNLFLPSTDFWKITVSNSRLSMKLQMMLDFYINIDSTFTKEYFLKFSQL